MTDTPLCLRCGTHVVSLPSGHWYCTTCKEHRTWTQCYSVQSQHKEVKP